MSRGGLRALSHGAAERALLARFEVTGLQRGATTLFSLDPRPGGLSFASNHASDRSPGRSHAWSFSNDVMGWDLGFHEGVWIGGEPASILHSAGAILRASGAEILQLTRVSTGEFEDAQPNSGFQVYRPRDLTIVRGTATLKETLPLASTYEDMLTGLGRHTRRNLRKARKQADAAGITFQLSRGDSLITDASRATLARHARPYPVSERRLQRFERYADLSGRAFRSVLRAADGDAISYCCGMFGSDRVAYLIYQLNDPNWDPIGPSLLHRAFLIEACIAAGHRELVFIHGCSGILRHSCLPMRLDRFWLMRRSPGAYLGTAAIAALKPKTPAGRIARAGLVEELAGWKDRIRPPGFDRRVLDRLY